MMWKRWYQWSWWHVLGFKLYFKGKATTCWGNARRKKTSRVIPRLLASATEWMVVPIMETGKRSRGRNQGFGLGHIKFEMSISSISTDVKWAVGNLSLVLTREFRTGYKNLRVTRLEMRFEESPRECSLQWTNLSFMNKISRFSYM